MLVSVESGVAWRASAVGAVMGDLGGNVAAGG